MGRYDEHLSVLDSFNDVEPLDYKQHVLHERNGRKKKQLVDAAEAAGIISPRKDGALTEAWQTVRGTTRDMLRGVGASMAESGIPGVSNLGERVEGFAKDWIARNQQDLSYEGWSPTDFSLAGLARTVAQGVTQSALAIAGGIAGTAIGGPGVGAAVGAASFAPIIYGDRVREYREAMPGLDDGDIKALALLSTALESVIEQWGGPESAVREIMAGTAKQVGGKALLRVAKAMAKGAVQEGSEEVWQSLTSGIIKSIGAQRNEMPSAGQLAQEFTGGAIPGAFLGGIGGMFKRGANAQQQDQSQPVQQAPADIRVPSPLEETPRPLNEQPAGRVRTTPDGRLEPTGKESFLYLDEQGQQRMYVPQGQIDNASIDQTVSADGGVDAGGETVTQPQAAIPVGTDEAKAKAWDFVGRLGNALGLDIKLATDEETAQETERAAKERGMTPEEVKEGGFSAEGWTEGNRIRVNPQADNIVRVVGHEIKHWMDKTAPGLSKQLDGEIDGMLNKRGREALKNVLAEYGFNDNEEGRARAREEWFCDVCGNLLQNPAAMDSFVKKLEARKPGMGRQFLKAVKDFVDRVVSYFRDGGEYDAYKGFVDNFETLSRSYGEKLGQMAKTDSSTQTETTARQSSYQLSPEYAPADDITVAQAQRQTPKQQATPKQETQPKTPKQEEKTQKTNGLPDFDHLPDNFTVHYKDGSTVTVRKEDDGRYTLRWENPLQDGSGRTIRGKAAFQTKGALFDNLARKKDTIASIEETKTQQPAAQGESEQAQRPAENAEKPAPTRDKQGTRTGQERDKAGEPPRAKTQAEAEAATAGTVLRQTPVGNRSVATRYMVVDADSLVTSEDEGYPERMQPRERSSSTLQRQIQDIASNMAKNPEAFGEHPDTDRGAPIAVRGRDGRLYVLSGNGRTLAARSMYRQGRGTRYERMARLWAGRHMSDTNGVRHPVLVSVMDGEYDFSDAAQMAELSELARLSNRMSSAAMTNSETAFDDARVLQENPEILSLLRADEGESLLGTANADFIRRFLEATHTDGASGWLNQDGTPTDALEGRVRSAMLGYLLRDMDRKEAAALIDRLLNDGDQMGTRRMLSGLLSHVPALTKLAAQYPRYDISGDLAEALRRYVDFRRDPNFRSLDAYLNQPSLFGDDSRSMTASQEAVMRLLATGQKSAKALRTALDGFIRRARDNASIDQSGFGLVEPMTKDEIVQSLADGRRDAVSPNSDASGGIKYSFRKKEPPKKTLKGYKLMRVDADGNLYALFIDRANRMKLGEWYDADSPEIGRLRELKDGVWLIGADGKATAYDGKGLPSVSEVEAATAAGARYMWIGRHKDETQKIHNVGINGSGTVATFAYRPGWHATNAPSAPHIGAGQGKVKTRRANEAWVEIEYAADNDYRAEAQARASLMKNGKPNPREAQLDRIPTDGYYYYRTNSNADERQDWILTGSIRPVRILDDAEVARINKEGGFRPDAERNGNKNAPTDGRNLSRSFSDFTGNARGSRAGATPGPTVLPSFDALLNIRTLSKSVGEVVKNLRKIAQSAEQGQPVPGHENALTPKNFVTSLEEAGFARKQEGAGSVYKNVGNITIRVSNHTADAHNFEQDRTPANLSIVIEQRGRTKDFTPDVKVPVVEALYLRTHLEQHPELLPSILKDIATAVATGEYHASAPAFDYHFSGTPEQIASARRNLAIDALDNKALADNLDRIYLRAVKKGDMETASAMVRARGEAAGYSEDDSWRMEHRAPNAKSDTSLLDLKESGLVPDDFWEKPEWYTSSPEERQAHAIVKHALELAEKRKAEGNPRPVGIVVYRAVDKTRNRLEGELRNGDWVTPVKAYAENEGMENPNGYRIIRKYALLKDLYWDGNSIAELGYDDGKNYAYRDTANNRKLLDAVTYDDNGEVIPLSKRFNSRESDTRFSFRRHRQVNPIFASEERAKQHDEWMRQQQYVAKSNSTLKQEAAKLISGKGGMEKALREMASGNFIPSTDDAQAAGVMLLNSDDWNKLSWKEQAAAFASYSKAGTEAGRNLAARRRMFNLNDLDSVQAAVRGLTATMSAKRDEDFARKVKERTGIDPNSIPQDVRNDRDRLDGFLRDFTAMQATFWDKLHEFWVDAILSGLNTHSANTFGNTGNGLYELGPKRLAEAAVNLFVRNPKGATFGEIKRMWRAFDIGKAWRVAGDVFDHEVLGTREKIDSLESLHGPAIGGKLGRWIRLPVRFLSAADALVKQLVRPMEATAMAYRNGVAQGLKGQELEDYIAAQLADEKSEANEYGRQRALELTFNEEPGDAVNWLMAMRNKVPGLRYIFPFVRTPSNLLRQGVRKGPLGIINLAWEGIQLARGKRQFDNEMIAHTAEQIVFWGAAMALMAGHGDDDEPWITGNAVRMQGGKGRFMNQHFPPMSIRVGDRWYSYGRIEPLATGLASFADGYNAYQEAEDGQKATAALKKMMTGAGKVMLEKSYLNSFQQVVNMLDDPEYHATDWASNFAASWVPNLYRQAVNALTDEVPDYSNKRKGVAWLETYFKHTLSRAGLHFRTPKYDYYGRPVTKDDLGASGGAFAWRLLMPVKVREADSMGDADRILYNYNRENPDNAYWPGVSMPFATVNGRKYSFVENYADFAQESGQLAMQRIEDAIRRGELSADSPTDRDISRVKSILQKARKEVKERFVRQGLADEE